MYKVRKGKKGKRKERREDPLVPLHDRYRIHHLNVINKIQPLLPTGALSSQGQPFNHWLIRERVPDATSVVPSTALCLTLTLLGAVSFECQQTY